MLHEKGFYSSVTHLLASDFASMAVGSTLYLRSIISSLRLHVDSVVMSQETFTPNPLGHMVFGPWKRAHYVFHILELWVTRNAGWTSFNVSVFLEISDKIFWFGLLLGTLSP